MSQLTRKSDWRRGGRGRVEKVDEQAYDRALGWLDGGESQGRCQTVE